MTKDEIQIVMAMAREEADMWWNQAVNTHVALQSILAMTPKDGRKELHDALMDRFKVAFMEGWTLGRFPDDEEKAS